MENLAQLRRLGLFEAKVPRYTSYPPATKFSNDVDSSVYADWINTIPSGTRVSLYLHVPFCRRLCWFCACRTQGVRSDAPVRAYLETLKQEIRKIGAMLPEGVEVARLHWGGGTPTLLSDAMITDLATELAQAFPYSTNMEFSVEIDPNGYIQASYDTGFTRTLYQVPLVDLPNPNGMVSLDRQTYAPSPESGSYFLWDASDGPTGDIVSYAREESATDVAGELTDMIQTQRAYSSNAKVIQTVDEMLQETTNIKR